MGLVPLQISRTTITIWNQMWISIDIVIVEKNHQIEIFDLPNWKVKKSIF